MIKFIDLNAQYLGLKEELDTAIRQCISESSFIKGKIVTEFENEFAEYLGAKHCIGCGNGTDALEMILAALNIGSGDEVIVPALSWIATAEAVNNTGAEPVFVDIDPIHYTIDAGKIEEKIGPKTRAIIPVHLFGCPAEMDSIMSIAEKFKLHIVEDCAQAHGAEYKSRKIGTFGVASAFSFFPSKNLGAFGDAGAVITDNEELADNVRRLSNHGQLNVKHSHSVIGRNSRLDSIQAAVLKTKLRHLDSWNEKRISLAKLYKSTLGDDSGLILPEYEEYIKHVFHLFVIRSEKRERLIEIFDNNGISWGIHYPNPIPMLEAYNYKKHRAGEFPVAFRFTREAISLPVYPELSESSIAYICSKILRK